MHRTLHSRLISTFPQVRWSAASHYGGFSLFWGWSGPLQLSTRPQHLPPALETLVWAPAWTRRALHQSTGLLISEPDQTHRYVLRRFAEDMLGQFPALKEVLYLWSGEGFFHCVLSDEGGMLEAHADTEHVLRNAWACVPVPRTQPV